MPQDITDVQDVKIEAETTPSPITRPRIRRPASINTSGE